MMQNYGWPEGRTVHPEVVGSIPAKPRFWRKYETSNLHGFELHNPSNIGSKLLFQANKAIKKERKTQRVENCQCSGRGMQRHFSGFLGYHFPCLGCTLLATGRSRLYAAAPDLWDRVVVRRYRGTSLKAGGVGLLNVCCLGRTLLATILSRLYAAAPFVWARILSGSHFNGIRGTEPV